LSTIRVDVRIADSGSRCGVAIWKRCAGWLVPNDTLLMGVLSLEFIIFQAGIYVFGVIMPYGWGYFY
jgi:hypothetical protein